MESILQHHGIKGMHWGIRRSREHSNVQPRYTVHGDGRIEIPPGEKMQRLVATKSKIGMSKSLNGHAFASFLPTDNAEYINTMAPKSTVKDLKRDTVLTLRTKNTLKSPSVEEAEHINIGVMKKYARELEAFTKSSNKNKNLHTDVSKEALSYLHVVDGALSEYSSTHKKTPAIEKELKMWEENRHNKAYDPTLHPEKYPALMYGVANRSLGTAGSESQMFNKELLGAIERKGYNMLRDENDVGSGRWASPVIIINPEKNVELVLSKKISNRTLRNSRKYIEKGKRDWKSLGLGEHEVSEHIKKGL